LSSIFVQISKIFLGSFYGVIYGEPNRFFGFVQLRLVLLTFVKMLIKLLSTVSMNSMKKKRQKIITEVSQKLCTG